MENNTNSVRLDEEKLEEVSGGVNKVYEMDMFCPFCGQQSVYRVGKKYICFNCDKEIPM